jgi:hypothetical protein
VLQGAEGDLGAELINGYTTSFAEGLSGPNDLYRLTLKVIGAGTADVNIVPASSLKFATSTPHGLKVGHTTSKGNPASSVYPASLSITATSAGPFEADLDGDGCIGFGDLAALKENWLGIDPNAYLFSTAVGHWAMNDNSPNTTVLDISGKGNHGTAWQNTVNLNTTGKTGDALTFDGTNDFVDVGNIINSGAYTKVAWIKRADTATYNNIISGDVAHAFYAPSTSSFKLRAGHNGVWNEVEDSSGLVANTWYHVAITYDPDVDSGTMVLYRDGSPIDTQISVPVPQASNTTYIGRYNSGYRFNGVIDNVMIFDRALTSDEIEFLYNGGSGIETPPTSEEEGDITDDGITNLMDFKELAEEW